MVLLFTILFIHYLITSITIVTEAIAFILSYTNFFWKLGEARDYTLLDIAILRTKAKLVVCYTLIFTWLLVIDL